MLKRNYLYPIVILAGTMIAIVPGMMRDSGQVTISIAGDIMLSRSVQDYLDQYGYDYPYEDVQEIFLNDDLTIGNLECPITDDENSADKTKRYIFRADEENAAALKRAGFDCLNLANNHTMDYLSSGDRKGKANTGKGGFIMEKKFKERYLAGEIEFEEIDEYSERWGMSDTTERLGSYLGLTTEEEDAWVSDGEDALYELLEQQKQ